MPEPEDLAAQAHNGTPAWGIKDVLPLPDVTPAAPSVSKTPKHDLCVHFGLDSKDSPSIRATLTSRTPGNGGSKAASKGDVGPAKMNPPSARAPGRAAASTSKVSGLETITPKKPTLKPAPLKVATPKNPRPKVTPRPMPKASPKPTKSGGRSAGQLKLGVEAMPKAKPIVELSDKESSSRPEILPPSPEVCMMKLKEVEKAWVVCMQERT